MVLVLPVIFMVLVGYTASGIELGFSISGRGTGGADSPLTEYTFEADVGTTKLALSTAETTVVLDTEAYIRWGPYSWEGGTYDIVSSVGVDPTGTEFCNVYSYCWRNESGGADTLMAIYFEAFHVPPVADLGAKGVCVIEDKSVTLTPSLPILSSWPHKQINVSVSGPDMVFGPSTGWAAGKGLNLTIGVFNIVNCLECTTAAASAAPRVGLPLPDGLAVEGGGGWVELHSIVDSKETGPCFAIFYFFPSDHSQVSMHYGLCPHTLLPLPTLTFTSHWTGSIIPESLLTTTTTTTR